MACGFVIKNISLQNFRNYEKLQRNFDTGVNKIIGPNAIGKTNIIEAICLLTQISSFKNAKAQELINNSSTNNPAKISAEIYDLATKTKNNISLTISESKKTYALNEKKKSISQLKGKFPSVVFTPDDLMLIKGTNTIRRNFIDNLGSQISKDYHKVLKDYNKTLKQKNTLLKNGCDVGVLQSINDVLVLSGAQLVFYRMGLIKKLLPYLENFYSEISDGNEKISVQYFPSWSMDDELLAITRDEARGFLQAAFEKNFIAEINQKRSFIGPHRDRIVINLDNTDSKIFASQGQQRSIVLALKLSEVSLIESLLDKRPILLLDDVMSELDKNRRTKLDEYIKDKTQVFITSTN